MAASCDNTPITAPGGIQPHGTLLVLRPADFVVEQCGANAAEFLGADCGDILGRVPAELLEAAGALSLTDWLRRAGPRPQQPLLLRPRRARPARQLLGLAHLHVGRLLLELELASSAAASPPEAAWAGAAPMQELLAMLRAADGFDGLCQAAVETVARLTGFDRVLLYRFDSAWNGQVIAESKAAHLDSFLSMHFPAGDIPQPARALYSRQLLRCTPDADYTMVPLLAAAADDAGPVDLSHALLRSTAAVHRQYLKNMGARASLSLSLLANQRLWGLILCAHASGPRAVPFPVRLGCELVGEVVASLLISREAQQDAAYGRVLEGHARTLQAAALAPEGDLPARLGQHGDTLLALTGASGVALCWGARTQLIGQTPSAAQTAALLAWLSAQPDTEAHISDRLVQAHPPAAAFVRQACGLLALSLAGGGAPWILWFRPAVAQILDWGGNPNAVAGPPSAQPRQSFERWREVVRDRALPWKPEEIGVARQLCRTLSDAIVQRSEVLDRLNQELQSSNAQLDAFAHAAAHDLQEPVRGIRAYTQLAQRAQGTAAPAAAAHLRTVQDLTERMDQLLHALLHCARVGAGPLQRQRVDLNPLVQRCLVLLRPRIAACGARVEVLGSLPTLACDPTRTAELLQNLLVNALKYNDKTPPEVHIGCFAGAHGLPVLFVRDNGIGIAKPQQARIFELFVRLHPREALGDGSGVGLCIARRIAEIHGGSLWVESEPGLGSTFYLTLAASSEEA